MDPVTTLRRIAFLLEREGAETYRIKAFRHAAVVIAQLPPEQVAHRAANGTLAHLKGVGPKTAAVVGEVVAGRTPRYLSELEAVPAPDPGLGAPLLAALQGDLHVHSDWSDGGSPIEEMAIAARDLGYCYLALTDHSARLRVANGLSRDRRLQQLEELQRINIELRPFRVLAGIEVDIQEDGSLDCPEDLLDRLDIVVASVHSKLRMPRDQMTQRLLAAVAHPHTNVLGHCTGRLVSGRARPESAFDSSVVFAACREHHTAVEINSRPERLDPPRRLLREAVAAGCHFSLATDAHAPGQLAWAALGAARAAECAVAADSVVNTWPVARLLDWAGSVRRSVPESSAGTT